MIGQGAYSETVEFFENLILELESSEKASPGEQDPRYLDASCADAHCFLGVSLGFEGNYKASLNHLNQSIELWDSLPTNSRRLFSLRRSTLNSVLSAKAAILAYLGEVDQANETWSAYKQCRQSHPDEIVTESFYLAARLYAIRSLHLLDSDDELDDSLRAEVYQSRAIESLTQFFHHIKLSHPEVAFIGMREIDAYYFDQQKNSDDFLAVRDDSDFQQLMSEVETALKRKAATPVSYFINSPQFRERLNK